MIQQDVVLFSEKKSRNIPGIPGLMILNPEKPGCTKIGKNEGPKSFTYFKEKKSKVLNNQTLKLK